MIIFWSKTELNIRYDQFNISESTALLKIVYLIIAFLKPVICNTQHFCFYTRLNPFQIVFPYIEIFMGAELIISKRTRSMDMEIPATPS